MALAVGPFFAPARCLAGPLKPAKSKAEILDTKKKKTLASVQMLILPSESDSPGAEEIGAIDYLDHALSDPLTDQGDIDSILSLSERLEDAAGKRHKKGFCALAISDQTKIIQELHSDEQGKELLGVLIIFTLEALLCDPVYGGNRDGLAWRWLGLNPPLPRPPRPWNEVYLEH